MASAFLSSILSKTSQVLGCVQSWAVSPSSSSDPRSSVLKDLEKLDRTLKRIQAALHDAEEREIRDESVKLWLKELKEVAYEADDVLDEYQYEVLRAQVQGRASRKRKRVERDDEEEVSIPDGMGDRIREIRERFDEISQDRERLRLREEDGERRLLEAPYPAPTSHMVDESSIYGRERDKQAVIHLLFSEGVGKGVSVIPIVGKGGLGKTTIAQLVYNDSKVQEYFDLTGWVCVSDDFGVPRLTKAILESLTRSSCDLAQLSTLQDTLKEKLKGKRVLLVLDDVWNDQQNRWESLRNAFIGADMVTIIMTSRNDSVAEIMQTVHPYHPCCLSPEQSWSLFRHYAFGGRDPEEQPRLVDMGKQVVQKCSGLPLAVKSIGSLLRYTTDEDSWMDVIQNDIWEVDENNEILPALRLSYSRMPAHLKPCFIYCSMFPKDYLFKKDELVRLWMAQGYIQTCGGRSMEDIGDEYFIEVQRRSFFDSYHSKFFKMHDMIHDLAKSIAENEFRAIMGKKLPSHDEVCHLYVTDEKKFWKSPCLYNFSALRTLLIMPWFGFLTTISEIIKNLPVLRCLRTLQFCWEMEYEIPDLLGNLKHLRYLHITSNKIEKLPESICLLYHLQILILYCPNVAELPDGLGNLTNLHHLQIGNWKILCLPAGIRKLTKLQSFLGCYKVQGGIGEVLKDLVNLRTLIISGLRNVVNIEDVRDAGLKYKHKLEKLFLHWNAVDCKHDPHHNSLLHLEAFPDENKVAPVDEKREEAMLQYLQPHSNLKMLLIHGYGGTKFPKWVENPFSCASLQEIRIINCKKIWSLPLYIHDSFGKLDAPISKSMLERVSISSCRQLTSIAGLHHLHSLKDLKIENCPQLRLLSEEGLPSKLQILHIEECQQLTSLLGMQNLTSLRRLIIQNCSKLQITTEDQLSSMPDEVEIVDCPGLCNWCLIQRINCIQVASRNKMTISNTWENIMHGFDDLASVEHLYFSNSWGPFRRIGSILLLQQLTIWGCTVIPPLPYLRTLPFLRRLVIKDCPRVHRLQSFLLPTILESLVVDSCEDIRDLQFDLENQYAFEELHLVNCPKLERVQGLNCLFFPKFLSIERCPRLRLQQDDRQPSIRLCVEDQLSSMPYTVKIVDCPGLSNWCQIQRINCIQVASGNKLTISNTWENIMSGFDDLTSIEYLCFSNSWKCFLETYSIPVLEELTIWGCTDITPLCDLHTLPYLRTLVIKDCPRIQRLPWHSTILLQSTLKSLVVDSCKHLRYLPLAQENRYAFEELQLVNCPKLEWVQGLNCIFFTKILRIERCPRLRFPQYDLPKFTNLRSLVIKDCPGFQFLPRGLFPSMLESLVVDSCEDLMFLPLAQQNRDALYVLQLVNCPKLIKVEGLYCLFFPEILKIERCPQLRLPQDDRQPSIPPHVEIEEETENKETIDDATQEKQVLDCLKTEHASSAEPSVWSSED